MSGAISQMQMLYVAEEDRILFRVNSTDKKEFRFWITRKYAFLLLAVLKKHADIDLDVSAQINPDAKQAVKSFKKEQAIQDADFKQKFNEDASEYPLGDVVPLAFKLNYKVQGEDLHLGIQPKEGKGIDMVISGDINPTFVQLILQAGEKGAWNLGSVEPGSLPKDRIVN